MSTQNRLLLDIEANGLDTDEVDKVWCIVCMELDNEDRLVKFYPETGEGYHYEFQDKFINYISGFNHFIAHNGLGYDFPVLRRHFGVEILVENTTDTLVLSRLFRPQSPFQNISENLDTRQGGHSLDAWGRRLGFSKIDFKEFDQFSEEMLEYCVNDVLLNKRVYDVLMREKELFECPDKAIEIEQNAAHILHQQKQNGFTLDKNRATNLLNETARLKNDMAEKLQAIFPPEQKLIRIVKPRYKWERIRNSDGSVYNPHKRGCKLCTSFNHASLKEKGPMHSTDKRTLLNHISEENEDGTYSIYEMVEFNPNSQDHIGYRLKKLGWVPTEFTPTGKPSTKREIIEGAVDSLAPKYPEVEALRRYSVVRFTHNKAETWLKLAEKDGKMHGTCFHIGTWTHRCAHRNDNMGNVKKVQLDDNSQVIKGIEGQYGWEMRSCWVPRKGWTLLGADASGIQLRGLAHYMEDLDYIKEVCEGDVHTTNQMAAGIKTTDKMHGRDIAKRFIYAWILGCGDEMAGWIVGVEENEYGQLFINRKETAGVIQMLRNKGDLATKDKVAQVLKGRRTKTQFLRSLPALKDLKEKKIPFDVKRGYIIGLDGRKIWIPNAHKALAAYLQSYEAIIMKHAIAIYHERLKDARVPFGQCAFIHDESQMEVPDDQADKAGKIVVQSIVDAGDDLGSLCPLAGEYKIGQSWAMTH